MDNATHSLVGYALGRAIAGTRLEAARGTSEHRFGRALIAASVIASNAPDFDFLSSFWASERRMLYLLEHRGLTHTLLWATLLGAFVAWSTMLAMQVRGTSKKLGACALGVFACLLHIGFDSLNDYGVHPFYPFDNHWYYGDSVFIVEPLLLALLLPLPLFAGFTLMGRLLSALLVLALLLLTWLVGLPVVVSLTVTGVLAAACLLQRRMRAQPWLALVGSVVVVCSFALGSRQAKAHVRNDLQRAVPQERVLDIVTSPAPADPNCFRALAVSLDDTGTYRARIARVKAFSSSAACRLLPSEPTAQLAAADVHDSPFVTFEAVFTAPAAELGKLAQDKCDAEAMLRFIRVPFWMQRDSDMLLGDLRYDRAPAIEFAERLLTDVCDSGRMKSSPWVPPRADLLRAK